MFEEGQEILDKRYRVIKKLGGGAFGEIFKGKQYSHAGLSYRCSKDLQIYVYLTVEHDQLLTFGLILKHNFWLTICVVLMSVVEKRKTGEHLAAKVVS